MDQAESEDQNFPGNIQQRSVDPGLDSPMRVPPGRVSQFQSKIGQFHAANPSGAAAQSLHQEEFNRTF